MILTRLAKDRIELTIEMNGFKYRWAHLRLQTTGACVQLA
jgi:hypothetical protein